MNENDAIIKLAKNVGATSPYALATAKLNKKINWSRVANPRKLLEDTLGMPYEKLFDPKHNSPLYANKAAKGSQRIDVGGNVVWVDPGAFFDVTGCDVTDPIQGALGDCYFIAALSSIAWARPYVIAERMFRDIDMIEFFQAGKSVKINISQLLPLSTPGNLYIYCRSGNTGEIWPALYEKAYAKWRTNDPGDKPNYAPIAGGDPVGALAQLTGFVPYYQGTSGISGHDCWTKVRANSISSKTFNPMVAWTYGTSPSPDVNYDNAHLAANHAYSLLGWEFYNNQEYIILRNPWGTYEATLDVLPGAFDWVSWDQPYYGGASGHWRPIHMATSDGVFGLRSDIFQKYFAAFGWVKTPEAP
jgi:hypothetical protein